MIQTVSTLSLLAERSPQSITSTTITISLHLALQGLIPNAVELLNLINTTYTFPLLPFRQNGLLFAFEAENAWPVFIPSEYRTTDFLENLDEEFALGKWGTLLGNFDNEELEPMNFDEPSLRRVMKYISSHGPSSSSERFEYPILDNQKILLSKSGARCLATDLALRLGGKEEEIALHFLSSPPLPDPEPRKTRHEIAKSRRAWRYLKDGILFQAKEKRNETLDEFERVKSALTSRIENGVKRPFKEKSMRELVEIINANTLAHDTDEATDDAEIEFIKDNNLVGNRTLLHPPATVEQIAEIEKKFDFPLPEDYKEFLSITNGLEGIWNGYFRARHLESIDHITKGDDVLTGDSALPCELITWEELPFTVAWPPLDLDRALLLNAGGDDGETWLVEPALVQEAVKAFFDAFEKAELDEQGKKSAERTVADYFGSVKEMKDMKYALLTWTHWGVTIDAWGSFREFLEGVAVESEREVSLD